MSEHAPGPWEYTDRTYRVDGKMYKTGDWAIMGGSYCLAQVAKEADARLIASAPDMAAEIERLKAANDMMLAAIKDVMTHAETLPEPPPYYENLCIVSAYAKGEWGRIR